MGILSKILGFLSNRNTQNAVNTANTINNIAHSGGRTNMTSSVEPPAQQAPVQQQSAPQSAQSAEPAYERPDRSPSADLKGDVRKVLAESFSQYQIREDVPVAELSPDQDFGGPIDFAVIAGGKIVAVIMLIKDKHCKRFWGVEQAAQKTGTQLLNFYEKQWFTPEGAQQYISRFI